LPSCIFAAVGQGAETVGAPQPEPAHVRARPDRPGFESDNEALLKDKICPMAVFDVLRKMSPLRQLEATELLINANNFSVSYASAILAGTPQAQLATPQTPKRLKGMTAEAIMRMERELSRLQEAVSSIQDSYGQDHLHLTVVKGHLRKLISNKPSLIILNNTSRNY
jgi:hypothetical protein